MPATELGHIISPLFRFSGLFFGPFLYKKDNKKSNFYCLYANAAKTYKQLALQTIKWKGSIKTLLHITLLLVRIHLSAHGIGSKNLEIISCLSFYTFTLYWFYLVFMSTKSGWFHLVDCLDLVDILAVTDQVHYRHISHLFVSSFKYGLSEAPNSQFCNNKN